MGSTDKILASLEILERLHRLPDTVALTTSEAAVFLRGSVSALEAMRANGTGPVYTQAGARGSAGSNKKCLYEKGDLFAWVRSNKIVSTMEAAVRKGQLFATLFDVVRTEAFWVDSDGRVLGMVERAPMGLVLERLGIFEIAWMPAMEAAAGVWADLEAHRALAVEIDSVLLLQVLRTDAAVEATELAGSLDENVDEPAR